MLRILSIALLFAIAACVQLPPRSQDIQAKNFDSVPGKAVIYIVRSRVDSVVSDTVWLDDNALITTHPGTYYRWEVNPGAHRIAGFAQSSASITLRSEPGKVYFVRHTVYGTLRAGVQSAILQQVSEQTGRALVSQAHLL